MTSLRVVVALAVLAGLDIGTSIFGLSHDHPEDAPGMAAIVLSFGTLAVAPAKAALTIVVLALLERIDTRPRFPATVIALALFVLPVVNNIVRLASH